MFNLMAIELPILIGIVAVVAVAIICAVIVASVIIKKKKSHKDAFSVNEPSLCLPPVKKSEPVKEEQSQTVEEPSEKIETPAEEEVAEEQPAVEEPAEEEVAEEQPAVEESSEEEVAEAQPAVEESAEEEVAEAQPAVEESAEEEVAEAQPAVEEPAEEEVAEEQPAVEEPAEEEVAEEQPAVEELAEEEVAEEETDEPQIETAEELAEEEAAEEEEAETEEEETPAPEPERKKVVPEGKVLMRVRYNRSYTAKIIQSSDVVKNYYTEIKNELLRYGVKERTSWKHETFRSGRKLLVRLAVRGKTLSVYMALNPADYEDSKYKVLDVSAVNKNKEVPLLYKIKNDRRCKYVKDLIADVMKANGLEAGEELHTDYASMYPYEELEPLIDRKLVKLLPWKEVVADSEVGVIAVSLEDLPPELLVNEVSVSEAEDMFIGEDMNALVSVGNKISDKTKKEIINIDTLGRYFEAGETVTVDEIKKRIPTFGKKVTYVKVLARGVLNKALTVEADDFSPAAVKMIVLTGGKVIRTNTNNN